MADMGRGAVSAAEERDELRKLLSEAIGLLQENRRARPPGIDPMQMARDQDMHNLYERARKLGVS